MAFITLDTKKLRHNYRYLDDLLKKNNIEWAVVSKMLCGNKVYLRELIKIGVDQLCDSRVSNLKMIKSMKPEIETVYIKPPPKRSVESIVKYADISFNTEIDTIELLSIEAKKQKKIHKIMIMIEMGELREGVMRDDLIKFYKHIFKLPNIEVVGIGTNLTCMYGVLPSHDKLIQLCLYEQLIESMFNREIQYVSGGSSVTLPLIFHKLLPTGINHFRIGETLFLGTNVYNNTSFEKMEPDIFQLFAEIIELIKKPQTPMGEMGQNVSGDKMEFENKDRSTYSYRAIIDLGLLDIDEKHIHLKNPNFEFVGATSDMLVVDLKENPDNLKVGELLEFKMDYMGVLRIMNSKYIEKRVK